MSVSSAIYALVKFGIFHVAWDVEMADPFTRSRYRRISILVACGRGKNGFVIVNYNAESHRRSLFSLSLFAALCRDHPSSFRWLDVDVESGKIEWIVLILDSLELGIGCGGIAGLDVVRYAVAGEIVAASRVLQRVPPPANARRDSTSTPHAARRLIIGIPRTDDRPDHAEEQLAYRRLAEHAGHDVRLWLEVMLAG